MSSSFFLGEGRPWTGLSTWDEVVTAAQDGLLGENQWVELKEKLPPAKPESTPSPARRRDWNPATELAKDLASLSVDGGLLIFGVTDSHQVVGTPEVDRLKTRITQAAAHGIHPPVPVVFHGPIPNPEDSSRAVLIVQVPPSAEAPHMVAGHYWGRSAEGKRILEDPEVRRLLALGQERRVGFTQRLDGLVDTDPLNRLVAGGARNGHVYLLAEPCTQVSCNDRPTAQDLGQAIIPRLAYVRDHPGSGLGSVRIPAQDPDGWGLVTTSRPVDQGYEHGLTFVSVRDDASVAVVHGGGTMPIDIAGQPSVEAIDVAGVTLLVLQTLELIQHLSLERWGYVGQWRVGLHLTNLAGKQAATEVAPNPVMLPRVTPVTYPQPSYRRIVTICPAAWQEGQPAEVARDVLEGFYRGLRLEQYTRQNILDYTYPPSR
jgi:hypothetical protein